MRTYQVFAARYNDFTDEQYRGKISRLFVADWTAEENKVGLAQIEKSRPPLAVFTVGHHFDEDAQQVLASKLALAANKMKKAQLEADITL